jgi:hypothetical protein
VTAVVFAYPATFCATAQTGHASTADAQKTFASADDAATALIKAASDYDVPALIEIFGPDGKDFVSTADPTQDKGYAEAFAKKAAEKHTIQPDRAVPTHATLVVGNDDWPLPVPIVKQNGKWHFDSKGGRAEVLRRRIGANELDAIQICRGFVTAQQEYASQQHDGVNQYAQKIISDPGKQDGLFWRNADGTPGGPISEAIARAIAEGYSPEKRSGFHGYSFKILKGQGPSAPLGRIDYVLEGAMIGGFALVAVPTEYRVTGVKTFMVSNYGAVYEKDLGPQSLSIVQKMELFNPDKTWKVTEDEWPSDADNQGLQQVTKK